MFPAEQKIQMNESKGFIELYRLERPCTDSCGLVWPCVALCGLVWPFLALCGLVYALLLPLIAFCGLLCSFYGPSWPNIDLIGLVSSFQIHLVFLFLLWNLKKSILNKKYSKRNKKVK